MISLFDPSQIRDLNFWLGSVCEGLLLAWSLMSWRRSIAWYVLIFQWRERQICVACKETWRITNEPEDICVTCAIWSYLNCAMRMTIFVKMCFRCQWDCQVYSTLKERERGKEMKISEIDGFFIHFVIKEAPQNCENVYRKYHVSNYVPSRQKLC